MRWINVGSKRNTRNTSSEREVEDDDDDDDGGSKEEDTLDLPNIIWTQ